MSQMNMKEVFHNIFTFKRQSSLGSCELPQNRGGGVGNGKSKILFEIFDGN